MQDFATQAEVEAGLEAYNRYFAEVWSSKQDEVRARLSNLSRELTRQEKRIQEIEDFTLDLESPPELRFEGATDSVGRMKVLFALPGSGAWKIRIKARMRVLPWTSEGSLLNIRIQRLRAAAEVEIDRTSPTQASLIHTRVSVKLQDIDLEAPSFLARIFARRLSFLLDLLKDLAEEQIRDVLRDSLPDAQRIRALQNLGLASEVPTYPEEPADLGEFEPQAIKISQRIFDHHLPFGTILSTLVPTNNIDGGAVGYQQFEDSATWTGHFLAAEIYRHKVTQDPQALENIRKALGGMRQLLHLTDDPGQLSRVVVPLEKTDTVQALDAECHARGQEERLFTSVDGKYRSIGHISRDQYMGAFLGIGWVALRVGDEELRAEARVIALEMVEYIISHLFCPTEAVADTDTGIKFTSCNFLLNPVQMLAILQLARRLDAKKYGALYDQLYPMWSVQWVFQWLQSLDPHHSYRKFNLEHAAALLLLALEDEPKKHTRLALGFRMVRQAVKNHANPYFDLVELETMGNNPDLLTRPREELNAEIQYLVAQSFKRAPLIEEVDLSQDSNLESVEIGGIARDDKKTRTLSRQPVYIMHRPGADFLWRNSPFNLRVAGSDPPENPAIRPPNVDLTLAFWIARKLGL